MEDEDSPSSPKQKLNSCFPIALPSFLQACDQHLPKSTADRGSPRHRRRRSHENLIFKEKPRNPASKMGRHHRRHSADFQYDQLSYSLNFEDDSVNEDLRNFKAGLPPPSPSPRLKNPTPSTTTGNNCS